MLSAEQKITPESLSSVTKLITSMREQKGNGKRTVVIISQAIKSARAQVKYLEKLKGQYKSIAK